MKLISRFMVTLTTITVAFGQPLIHVSTHRSHCIPPKVTAWCGFTGSFIIGPFFFETQCPVNGWITETVNAQRYLTLLRETAVPCLIQRGQISNVTFMQDGATSHTANPVKAFLIQTFGEDRIVSRRCRYPWPPRSPDLTPADFWLWGYLKSRVYLSGPSSLSELKDAIRREYHTSGHVALCRFWICHSSRISSPLWWWSCGTYSGTFCPPGTYVVLSDTTNVCASTTLQSDTQFHTCAAWSHARGNGKMDSRRNRCVPVIVRFEAEAIWCDFSPQDVGIKNGHSDADAVACWFQLLLQIVVVDELDGVPRPVGLSNLLSEKEFLGVPLTPPKRVRAFPTPGRRQCTHKYIMVWVVLGNFRVLGSH
ncbi:DUF4817 domain-containing protein [Trichonephila clavipes]|nr:DUF4817 domain-containing protein [Trichonephila clavipes]